jgi:hypothetical protein
LCKLITKQKINSITSNASNASNPKIHQPLI